jgi:hypothetical protein
LKKHKNGIKNQFLIEKIYIVNFTTIYIFILEKKYKILKTNCLSEKAKAHVPVGALEQCLGEGGQFHERHAELPEVVFGCGLKKKKLEKIFEICN